MAAMTLKELIDALNKLAVVCDDAAATNVVQVNVESLVELSYPQEPYYGRLSKPTRLTTTRVRVKCEAMDEPCPPSPVEVVGKPYNYYDPNAAAALMGQP